MVDPSSPLSHHHLPFRNRLHNPVSNFLQPPQPCEQLNIQPCEKNPPKYTFKVTK